MYEVTPDSDVYVSSLWHADCDPFWAVTILDGPLYEWNEQKGLNAFVLCALFASEASEEERERVLDQDCEESCEVECEKHDPDIRESGVLKFKMREIALTEEQTREFSESGYVYH